MCNNNIATPTVVIKKLYTIFDKRKKKMGIIIVMIEP
jgi:hypothetical protein